SASGLISPYSSYASVTSGRTPPFWRRKGPSRVWNRVSTRPTPEDVWRIEGENRLQARSLPVRSQNLPEQPIELPRVPQHRLVAGPGALDGSRPRERPGQLP